MIGRPSIITPTDPESAQSGRPMTEVAAHDILVTSDSDVEVAPDYLREVARHKIVLQLDRSHVPGQVAGDALLCRLPCVGGDGAIERIAFSKTCGEGRTITEIASMALDLLRNADLRGAIVAESEQRALEQISFRAVRSQLANFFAQLSHEER